MLLLLHIILLLHSDGNGLSNRMFWFLFYYNPL